MSASETQISAPPVVLHILPGKRCYYPANKQNPRHNPPLPSYHVHLSRPSTLITHVGRQGCPLRAFRRSVEGYQALGAARLHYGRWHAQGCDYLYERNPDYNVPGSKLNRGKSVIDAAEIIKGTSLTNDEYLKAAMLGWGIELVQALFLVSDMMDSLFTRRGQPCWYRVPKVGQIAINDSFVLEVAIYHLLKKHFRGESYYADIPGDDVPDGDGAAYRFDYCSGGRS